MSQIHFRVPVDAGMVCIIPVSGELLTGDCLLAGRFGTGHVIATPGIKELYVGCETENTWGHVRRLIAAVRRDDAPEGCEIIRSESEKWMVVDPCYYFSGSRNLPLTDQQTLIAHGGGLEAFIEGLEKIGISFTQKNHHSVEICNPTNQTVATCKQLAEQIRMGSGGMVIISMYDDTAYFRASQVSLNPPYHGKFRFDDKHETDGYVTSNGHGDGCFPGVYADGKIVVSFQ